MPAPSPNPFPRHARSGTFAEANVETGAMKHQQAQRRQHGAYGFQKRQRFGDVGPLADATTSSAGVGANLDPRTKLVKFRIDQIHIDFAIASNHNG
jgi:hypothetical protein